MGIVLKILGIVFLLLVITVVGGFFFLRRWFRKALSNAMLGAVGTPSTITLEPLGSDDDEIFELDKIEPRVKELEDVNFQRAGQYIIPEMPGVIVLGLVREEDCSLAAVYQHMCADMQWVDIVCEATDGQELTVSSAPEGEAIDSRPEATKIFLPKASVSDLLQKFSERKFNSALRPVSVDDFQQRFVEGYEKEMSWRNARGGAPTREEFMRTAKESGLDLTDEQLEESYFDVVHNQSVERLSEECLEAFRTETTLSVREWTEVEDRCFALHEHIPADHLERFIESYYGELTPSQKTQLASLLDSVNDSREVFEQFNRRQPDNGQSRKLGEVRSPVYAEIFAAPEYTEESC